MMYALTLLPGEHRSLAAAADIYPPADRLLESLAETDDPNVFLVSEDAAYRYDADLGDDGLSVPPYVSGPLADTLRRFRAGIA